MSIGKFKKDELRSIADELKLVVPDNAKVLDLRELIQESEIYKNDKETYQAIVDCVLEEINDKRNENENRLEIEKIKLSQLEKELEIAKLHNHSGKSLPLQNENQLITTECNIESLIKSIKTLTIPVPLRAESFNLFFQSIEKAFKTKNVPEKLKPEILLNILGEKANNLMIYLRDEDLSDYNKLKAIVLKEFQPTPYECLNQFKKAQKLPSESYVQFASRLSANFNYYCQLREVNDFKSVCELVISDKIIETLDRELNTHISIKQGEMWFKPQDLARECDILYHPREKLENRIYFLSLNRDNQTVQRSVLNPLADVFGGPGGSNCVVPPQGENEENKSFVATSFLKNKTRTVLLSSVQCFLRDKYGLLHEVRALLDVGSQSHFITKDCADRLQLKNEKINLLVSCLNESTMTINGGVTTSIFNGDLSFKKELNLLVVRRITDLTPSQIINVSLDMPNEIKLADYKFNIPGKIDVLLGAEIFYELLRPGQIYCGDSRLLLQNTVFGYVVSGSVGDEVRDNNIHCGLIRDSDLNTTLRSFWELESIGVKNENCSSEEDVSFEMFKQRVHFKNGRYEVELPWKRDSNELSDNFSLAKRRLGSLMRKMQRDKVLYSEYYLLISFRSNKIAVLADVEKAFLQISLAPKDRDVVRFLIDDGENGVQVYRFNRVLFGVNASPFLLAATIKTHIGKCMEKYPDTVRTLDHCFYVDDLVTGEDDAKSAFDLSSKAAKIMSEAGMNLRKWISNDCELMKQWQLEHFDHLNMNDFVNHPHRVLGLLWHPQKDYLSLRLTSLLDFLQKRKNTKRFLLMAAGRIFDPLGFASPFTIRFKILFQEIWQRKTDWDEELLPDIREKFEQWCSEASFLCELQIPRYALQCDSVNCPECEIHTFSDASIKAYGAVSYVRLRTFDKISVHLLASKSRVAPLKVLTLPRLELMGALLAARLAKEVSRVLNEKISTTNYFWTDSTIALSWIQGPSNRWKVFVANRVKEIRSLTDKDSWRHCPGKDNPSDLLTRGISADSLINCEKWWKGPSFLQEGNTVPVSNNVLLSDESAYLEELKPTERKTLTVILDNNLLNHILSVSNNFQKNLCIFSYIYRFINNCKRPSNKQIGPLRMCEIQRAEITLVKLVQQMEFNSEIKDLSCQGMVNPQSKIRNLSPFLDSENVLRVGGRLTHSKLCFDKKTPDNSS
ncbi:integrase catalytic domain-containing protein [Trichonephila clavipes]|uniref:Integrase catalytic domain-containing protein n=2 Tax=Trichonephila clavipes TaxID=2585209 RepID=A0A8X6WFZ3_TRICX|nr:integrase catalytic domain-containing protein [Trichonephila clavipes]